MLQALRQRQREDGFTLIELMVVVLIIAILIAIAIPTFLGARERAQEKAAQSDARNGLTAAKTIFTDGETYTGIDAAALGAVEPSLTFGAVADTDTETVGFLVENSGDTIVMVREASNGTFHCMADDVRTGGGSYTKEGANLEAVNTFAECSA